MNAILRTADGIECMVTVPKFAAQICRPILSERQNGETGSRTVTHIRIYAYYGNQLSDDTPIYREVLE